MKTSFLLLFFTCFFCCFCNAQQAGTDSMQLESIATNKSAYVKRPWLVGSLSAAGYGGSLFVLNEAWYKQYPKTSFHTFNDNREWLQVDKTGHAWTAYQASRGTTALWKWAGLNNTKATLAGSLSGFAYMSVIEILDAHSANWGWSWGDMGANFFGASLFAGQQLAWKEQRIQFKFSAHAAKYDGALKQRTDDLFGASFPEHLLKDYNAQTYWLSFNLHDFLPQSTLPAWLNMAVGYGATGMYGGFKNMAYDKSGNITFNRTDIKRFRQWYLSPDVDFTKIKTNSRFLKTSFFLLNAFKFPAPSVMYGNGKWKASFITF